MGDVSSSTLVDREGITQIRFDSTVDAELYQLAGSLRNEYVLAVQGLVESRGENVNGKWQRAKSRF